MRGESAAQIGQLSVAGLEPLISLLESLRCFDAGHRPARLEKALTASLVGARRELEHDLLSGPFREWYVHLDPTPILYVRARLQAPLKHALALVSVDHRQLEIGPGPVAFVPSPRVYGYGSLESSLGRDLGRHAQQG